MELGPKMGYEIKCNMIQLTNKRINQTEASYTLEGRVFEIVDNYLGVLEAEYQYHKYLY